MKRHVKLSKKSIGAILGIVEPILENYRDGSIENDHAKHARDFTGRLKSIVTTEELSRQLCTAPCAYFTKREFLNIFRRQESIGIVWKQPISLNADQLINQVIFTEENGRVLIDHCMIC
jgi:hypothetical protein